MIFHSSDKRRKRIKAEPPVSQGLFRSKSSSSSHMPNSGKEDQSALSQRNLPNQTTNQADNIPVPSTVKDVIQSPGKTLDTTTRTFMESHFGHDFSHVRVHTNAKAAESARSVGARAYTVGTHVVFNTSEYKPRTLVGDSLIAHELAHVIQQEDKNSHFPTKSASGVENSHLEEDANSSIPLVVASILSGTRSLFGRIAQGTMPSLRSGLRLQRCQKAESIQAPPFLGTRSRETLDQINRIMENGGALQQWIAFGQIIVSFENPLQALETAEAAEAIAAVPVIVRSSVRQQIELLLVTYGNELSREERAFWERLLERF